jgi:hypothetical protein
MVALVLVGAVALARNSLVQYLIHGPEMANHLVQQACLLMLHTSCGGNRSEIPPTAAHPHLGGSISARFITLVASWSVATLVRNPFVGCLDLSLVGLILLQYLESSLDHRQEVEQDY